MCVFSGVTVDIVYFCCVVLQFMVESRDDMQTRKHEESIFKNASWMGASHITSLGDSN